MRSFIIVRSVAVAAFLVTCGVRPSPAADAGALRGAAAVLDQLSQNASAAQPAKPLSASARLRVDVSNFTSRASSLAAPEAAREWLALVDRLSALPAAAFLREGEDGEPLRYSHLVAAIPPPAAWTELAKAITARPAPKSVRDAREVSLRMLAAALSGDRTGLNQQAKAFDELLLKAKREEAGNLIHASQRLHTALLAWSEDPTTVVAGIERQLADVERERERGYSMVQIPDVVSLLGENAARPLLERALKSKAQSLRLEGKATRDLAQKLALSLINDLQVPRWDLVNSAEAVELFEALSKKFAQTNAPAATADPTEALAELQRSQASDFGRDHEKQSAQTHYLIGLILRQRTADAAAFAAGLQDDESGGSLVIAAGESAISRAGFMNELDDFLHDLLSKRPELPFWPSYISAAARSGTTTRMLGLARAAAANPALSSIKRDRIRENLYRALLAADQVDEGVKELQALVSAPPKLPTGPGAVGGRAAVRRIEWQQHSLALARLGQLLNKPEWLEQGLAAARPQPVGNGEEEREIYGNSYQAHGYIRLLVQSGRLAEAEESLINQMSKTLKAASARERMSFGSPFGSSAAEPMKSLANLYHRAGRWEDVLLLLEKSPHWGVKDLAELTKNRIGTGGFEFEGLIQDHLGKGSGGDPFAQAVASALIRAGRKNEARTIVDALLDKHPGNDRAYELLVELAGLDAVPRLDALFARDAFEERPLIWKAFLLHKAGRQAEAETIARQAIAIDPSDGEQGKNDRMRVYSILADIRAARGDSTEAEGLRGAIRAIRLSEQADDYFEAGLLSRAVKMYRDSLAHFTDAYCIQSRLAVRLSELGQHELAALHYEKAFELMPDSFGRVESHCFGCEGAFTGPQAQSVAERVFTALVAKNPQKAQIHYLLGYLRKQQGRGKDAIPHFRAALKIDPDYLNAWNQLEELSQDHRLPIAERDDIAFNILRLDPLGRHASGRLDLVGDLRRLWTAVEVASKLRPSTPTALLALPASRVEVEKREQAAKAQRSYFGGRNYFEDFNQPVTPQAALARHELIAAISEIASAGSYIAGDE